MALYIFSGADVLLEVFMIKTEKEYLDSKTRLEVEFIEINAHAERIRVSGVTEEQIKLALDPLTSFALQLKEEIEEYEKIKKGQ